MITVSFEKELREAFAAGQAAATAQSCASMLTGAPREYFERVPKTYDEWIASIADRPATVRG